MIQTIDLRGIQPSGGEFRRLLPRPAVDVSVAVSVATELITAVREHGSVALLDQAERFDGVRPNHLRVPAKEIADAVAALPDDVRAALEEAIRRVRAGTAAQVPPRIVTDIGAGAS